MILILREIANASSLSLCCCVCNCSLFFFKLLRMQLNHLYLYLAEWTSASFSFLFWRISYYISTIICFSNLKLHSLHLLMNLSLLLHLLYLYYDEFVTASSISWLQQDELIFILRNLLTHPFYLYFVGFATTFPLLCNLYLYYDRYTFLYLILREFANASSLSLIFNIYFCIPIFYILMNW